MSKLGELIHRETKAREESEVAAIVGGSNGMSNAEGRGKFSDACAEAQRERAATELGQARQLIMDDPKIIDGGPGPEAEFYGRFPAADIAELRVLVGAAKSILHPRPANDDVPEAKPGRFVKFRPKPGW